MLYCIKVDIPITGTMIIVLCREAVRRVHGRKSKTKTSTVHRKIHECNAEAKVEILWISSENEQEPID